MCYIYIFRTSLFKILLIFLKNFFLLKHIKILKYIKSDILHVYKHTMQNII
jgi:hypothetical protein